jgi:hypothetical protein
MPVFYRNDLDKASQAVETLSFEKRVIILFSELPDDSFDETFDIEAASLFGLEHYHIFRKTAKNK